MIWLTGVEKSMHTGQIDFCVCIDAKAAAIKESPRMRAVQHDLDKLINNFTIDVRKKRDYNESEEKLKNYLCENLFRYSVDIIAVNDFIYDLKKGILDYSENICLAGYSVSYVYKNFRNDAFILRKVAVGDSDQIFFTILIDAAVAEIKNRDVKIYVESELNMRFRKHVFTIMTGGDSKETEEAIRVYLAEDLFNRFVNFKIIDNFIRDFNDGINKFFDDIEKHGSVFEFEYKNHSWEEEDDEERKKWDEWDKKNKN